MAGSESSQVVMANDTSWIDVPARALMSARREGWFATRPVFVPRGRVTADELDRVEWRIGTAMPRPLLAWLLEVGYGEVDEVLSFFEEWHPSGWGR